MRTEREIDRKAYTSTGADVIQILLFIHARTHIDMCEGICTHMSSHASPVAVHIDVCTCISAEAQAKAEQTVPAASSSSLAYVCSPEANANSSSQYLQHLY